MSSTPAPRTVSRTPLGTLPTRAPRSSSLGRTATVVARRPPSPTAAAHRSYAAQSASAAVAHAAITAAESQIKVISELADAAVEGAVLQMQAPPIPALPCRPSALTLTPAAVAPGPRPTDHLALLRSPTRPVARSF